MKDTSYWAVLHTGIWDHPKMVALCEVLGVSEETAAGILTRLQHAGLVHAADGVFHGWTRDAVERALHISAVTAAMMRGRAIDGLISAGFAYADGTDIVIHGWADYTGAYLSRLRESRERDAARKRVRRTSENVRRTDSDVQERPTDENGRPKKSALSYQGSQGSQIREVRSPDADTEHPLSGWTEDWTEEATQTDPDPAPARTPQTTQDPLPAVSLRATRPPPRTPPRGIHGLNAEALWPKTLDELLAVPQVVAMRATFPAYTDKVPGCIPWRDAVGSWWDWQQQKLKDGERRAEWGEPSLRYLRKRLSDGYDASRKAYDAAQRSGAVAAPTPVAADGAAERPNDHGDWVIYRNRLIQRDEKPLGKDAWVSAGRPDGNPIEADVVDPAAVVNLASELAKRMKSRGQQ